MNRIAMKSNSPSEDDSNQHHNNKMKEIPERGGVILSLKSRPSKVGKGRALRRGRMSLKRYPTQNPYRNIPGLILQRVKRMLISFCDLESKDRNQPEETKLLQSIESLTPSTFGRITELASQYRKNYKTWFTIRQVLMLEPYIGQIIVDTVVAFLGDETGADAFSLWMTKGKLSHKTKRTVIEGKQRFKEKFLSMNLFDKTEKNAFKKKIHTAVLVNGSTSIETQVVSGERFCL